MRALVVAAFVAIAGCSSEANPTPPNNTFKVDSGTPIDTGLGDTGEVDTGTPDANCFGDGGCFACPPRTNDQFLNRCSGSQCSKFDDKTRIPSSVWDGGALPPVP
jgi:hypothetical protein